MCEELSVTDVLRVIVEIAERVRYRSIYNERYLHHFFTRLLQERHGLLCNILEDTVLNLHPEWPTYKKYTQIKYGQYRTVKETRGRGERKILKPVENSCLGGKIDFTIGRYERPIIGVEFTLSYGWSGKDVEGDLVKLLDSRNPFDASISFNLVFREKGLSKGGWLTKFENAMNERLEIAVKRLRSYGRFCGNSLRQICLIVTEVGGFCISPEKVYFTDSTIRPEMNNGVFSACSGLCL